MSAKFRNAESIFESVATETLHIISNHLADSPRALTTFMRLCRRTAAIGARIRYSSLYIRGFKGQCLLAMLVSGTTLSNEYCLLVRRLWLQGTVCTELELVATLLSQALYLMDNLVAFAAEALPIDCAHLLRSMKREGLIRESNHPSLAVTVSEGSPDRYSLYTLPRLRSMMLNGDPTLLRSAAYRPLTELIVDYILSDTDWATFMTMTDGTILGDSLKTLWIKFGRGIDMQLAIPILSRTFPNLVVLALSRGGLEIAVSPFLLSLRRSANDSPSVRNSSTISVARALISPTWDVFGSIPTTAITGCRAQHCTWRPNYPLTRCANGSRTSPVVANSYEPSPLARMCGLSEIPGGSSYGNQEIGNPKRWLHYSEVNYALSSSMICLRSSITRWTSPPGIGDLSPMCECTVAKYRPIRQV